MLYRFVGALVHFFLLVPVRVHPEINYILKFKICTNEIYAIKKGLLTPAGTSLAPATVSS